MNTKQLTTFFILIALSFSLVHEFAFTLYDEKKCNVSEYISELNAPVECGDICDIHYEYHQSYIATTYSLELNILSQKRELSLEHSHYKFTTIQKIVIPPIA